MIKHTGYDVWCDQCGDPNGCTVLGLETKRAVWKRAKKDGWVAQYQVGKKKHYCRLCAQEMGLVK